MRFLTKSAVVGILLVSGFHFALAASSNIEMVTIKNYQFIPSVLVVAPGTTVMWTNADSVSHTVTATDGSWNSEAITSGANYRHLFKTAGTFVYTCTYHSSMQGKIVVSNNAPAN